MVTKVLFRILLCLIICLIALKLIFRLDPGLKQLEADFRVANQAKTIEPMLELYHLEGSDELSIVRLKGALQYELGLPIADIKFEPLSDASEEKIQFTHNGIPYGPTLNPSYKMRVVYKGKERFTSIYTIGKTDSDAWKFIVAKPLPMPSK